MSTIIRTLRVAAAWFLVIVVNLVFLPYILWRVATSAEAREGVRYSYGFYKFWHKNYPHSDIHDYSEIIAAYDRSLAENK